MKRLCIIFLQTKKPDKKGEIPVYCRVTYSKKRASFSTQIRCKKKDWNQGKQSFNTSLPNAREKNTIIRAIYTRISEIYHSLLIANENISSRKLVDLFRGKNIDKSLLNIAQMFIDEKKIEVGIKIQKNTFENLRRMSCDYLYDYLREVKKTGIEISEVNESFARKFEIWLISKKFSQNYVNKIVGCLKKILRYAYQLGVISINPLEYYSYERTQGKDIIFLTEDEVNTLYNHHFTSEKLQKIKDLFLFQAYTGLAFVDLMRFDAKNNLQVGIDGKEWLVLNRKKTGTKTTVPFLKQAKEILTKYSNHLPTVSNQKYNVYLKEIAEALNIDKTITTHVARKTFGMFLLNSGVSMEVVSKCLGHRSIKTTESSYANIQEHRISREINDHVLMAS